MVFFFVMSVILFFVFFFVFLVVVSFGMREGTLWLVVGGVL